MSRRRVVISLVGTHLALTVLDRSRVRLSSRFDLNCGPRMAEWCQTVSHAGRLLEPFIQKHRLSGLPATVLYRSPTEVSDLTTFDVNSTSKAVAAAELSCLDSINYSPDLAVTRAVPLGRDRRGGSPQVHVLALAEHNDALAAMGTMVEDAGLRFTGATPLAGLLLGRSVIDALRSRSPLRVVLRIGHFGAVFAASRRGSILFARDISFGIETLVNSLTRLIRQGAEGESVQIGAEAARRILVEHGLPEPSAVVSEHPLITGAQILPLIEPLLQRFVVELKQSLRFGLPDELRQSVTVTLEGPGAGLNGLAGVLSRGLEIDVKVEDEPSNSRIEEEPDEVAAMVRRTSLLQRCVMLPTDLVYRLRAARLRSWMWTGAAAAGLLLAFESVQWDYRLRDLRESAGVIQRQEQELEQLRSTTQRVQGIIGALRTLRGSIDDRIGERIDYHALLKEISRVTPASIRLTRLEFEDTELGCRATLHGIARSQNSESEPQSRFTGTGDSNADGPGAFVARLRESPLIADATLGVVRHGAISGESVHHFELAIEPQWLPRREFSGLADASRKEELQ